MAPDTANRRFVLARLPRGLPQDDDFRLESAAPRAPAAGEVALRTIFLSLDPYQRNWMAGATYSGTTAAPGATVIGRTVGEVLASADPRFAPGDIALGETGWQTRPVMAADRLEKIDPSLGPVSTALGVLGSPGLTAWVGITDIGQPKAGETVLVSAAAGAVGAIAGQLAKKAGARVVGVAGEAHKCRHAVDDLGFDACVSHRAPDLGAELARACPQGVDVFFDNTGGAVTAAVFPLLRTDARVALCGLVAEYDDPDARGPSLKPILSKQALVRGFSVRRNLHRMPEYRRMAAAWLRDGSLRYREHVVEGFENTPAALRATLEGRTLGKALVRVGADPAPR